MRAAQAALAAEFVKSDPAHRTGLLVEVGQFLGRLPDGHLLHLLGQGRGHTPRTSGFPAGRGGQVRPGVVLAKVQFLGLPAGQFRDVECCRTLALLAFHGIGLAFHPASLRF